MPIISRSLNVLARCGNQFRSARLASLNLTAAQAPYILHICARPHQSQEQLAKALHVNPSSAARQLASLEEKGYILREPSSSDKRLLLIAPSDKAIQAEPLIREVNRAWNDYLTSGMSGKALKQLEEMLQLMLSRAVLWECASGTPEGNRQR